MMGVASTTVCAYQASMGRTASARGDPVSRQGECWPLGVSLKLDEVVKEEAGLLRVVVVKY